MTSSAEPPSGGRDLAMLGKPIGENALLKFVQRPRIMLLLLAAWEAIGFLTQLATNTGLFIEDHKDGDIDLDGVLAGRALAWESVPLAVLYLYCARDPQRYQRVFWLALIEQIAAVAAYLYHWLVVGTFTFESIFVPLLGSGAMGTLVFLHLFRPRAEEAAAPAAPAPQE